MGFGDDTVRMQFTGYERDGEIDLDFAQARMYGNNLGRFYSPDPYEIVAEVQQQKDVGKTTKMLEEYISTPQRWNRYAYVQDNPYRFVDPSGEIEVLTGSAAVQKKALQRLREELGPERMKFVKFSKAVSTRDGSRGEPLTILSISKSDYEKFSQIGNSEEERSYSVNMGVILKSDSTVEFTIADVDSHGYSVPASGGGTTYEENGIIKIFVSNNAVRDANTAFGAMSDKGADRSSDKKPLTFTSVYEIDAHEHGHAADRVRGHDTGSGKVNTDASVSNENTMRLRQHRTQLRTIEGEQ